MPSLLGRPDAGQAMHTGPWQFLEERVVQPTKQLAQQALDVHQHRWDRISQHLFKAKEEVPATHWKFLPFAEDPGLSSTTTKKETKKSPPLPPSTAPAAHRQALAHHRLGIEETMGFLAILFILISALLTMFKIHQTSSPSGSYKTSSTTASVPQSKHTRTSTEATTSEDPTEDSVDGPTVLATGGTVRPSSNSGPPKKRRSRRHSPSRLSGSHPPKSPDRPPVESITIARLREPSLLNNTNNAPSLRKKSRSHMSLSDWQALQSMMHLSRNTKSSANLLSLRASQILWQQPRKGTSEKTAAQATPTTSDKPSRDGKEPTAEVDRGRQILYEQWGLQKLTPTTTTTTTTTTTHTATSSRTLAADDDEQVPEPPPPPPPPSPRQPKVAVEIEMEVPPLMAMPDGSDILMPKRHETAVARASLPPPDNHHQDPLTASSSTPNPIRLIMSREHVEAAYQMCLSVSTNETSENDDDEDDDDEMEDDDSYQAPSPNPPTGERHVSFQDAKSNTTLIP